jgi:hypothetical protein
MREQKVAEKVGGERVDERPGLRAGDEVLDRRQVGRPEQIDPVIEQEDSARPPLEDRR